MYGMPWEPELSKTGAFERDNPSRPNVEWPTLKEMEEQEWPLEC